MNLQFFDFSRRAHLAIESTGAFLPCKIVCHVAITWNFPLYPFFLVIVVQSVTTEVVTLCTTVMIISPPIRDGSATPEKTKWELVIRDKNFLDLNTGYHCRHSFCFALSRIHKKDISECLRAKL